MNPLSIKKISASLVVLVLLTTLSATPRVAKAELTMNNLGDLVILSSLFSQDSSGLLSSTDNNIFDLGNLLILDKLFNNGNTGIRTTRVDSSRTNLGDLIILDKLFSGNGVFVNGASDNESSNLGRLFVLDRLFNTGQGLFGRSSPVARTNGAAAPRPTTPPATTTPNGNNTPTPTPTSSAIINISVAGFQPNQITIPAGTTVVWRNIDTLSHTTRSTQGLWDSGLIEPGEQFSRTFTETGILPYQDQIFPERTGTIIVQ